MTAPVAQAFRAAASACTVARCVAISGVWLLISSITARGADFEPPLLIRNARVVVTPGTAIERASILIERGRIAGVDQSLDAPPGADVTDLAGATVYAGFIDACSHAGITRAEPTAQERARVEDEYPDVRDGPHAATVAAYRRLVHPHWRAEESIDPQSPALLATRRAGFTTALISPKPAILAGSSAVLQLGDRPLRRSLLRTSVAMHAAMTHASDDQPGGGRFDQPAYPTTLMGAAAAFRQVMLDAAWQRDLLTWFQRNPKADRPAVDRDLSALVDCIDGRQPVAFYANSENEILRALDLAREFRLRPMIVGGREAWRCAERLKSESVPVALSLKWPDEPKSPVPPAAPTTQPVPGADRLATLFDERWQSQPWEPQRVFDERVRLWGEQVDNARRLHEVGVSFSIATFELESPAEVIKSIRKAIERGLPEDAAVAALTRNGAAFVGLDSDLGQIAPGRVANLTVMSGGLADEKANVCAVVVDGRLFHLPPADDKRRGDSRNDGEKATTSASQPAPTSAATSSAAATSTSQPIEWPDHLVEIEADRSPTLRTGGSVLLRSATLLTITHGDMANTDLLVENGRISRIGRGLSAPPGVPTLELAGCCVMPGIIDCHSHMCSDGGLNEFSMSITCEVRVRDVISHRDVSAYRALAGGVTCIHTMHGSANTIGGQNAVLRLKYGRPAAEWLFQDAPRTVKFALGENVKQSNFGRRGSRFPNSRMGVETVLRRAFDAARRYDADRAAFAADRSAGRDPRPLRRDLRLEALSEILAGDIRIHCHCYRADEILRLFAVTEEYGVRVALLHHVLEGYRVIPEMLRHGCGASTFADWWAYKLEAYDAVPHNAARMVQGGVVASVNSDSPEMIRHLNLEAAKSLRYGGLSPGDALRLITLNAARQLGIDRQTGSIEVGKLADLAVFDGHPLDAFSKCVLTLIDGEVYFQHPEIRPNAAVPATRPARAWASRREPLAVPPSPGGVYLVRGATVHPMDGPELPDAALLIERGRIAAFGPAAAVAAPAQAVVVDATGLHVYPGLINAACSLGLVEIDSVVGSVDTSDIGRFQPDLRAESAYNPFAAAIEVARAEGVLTALVVPGGNEIAGQAALMQLDGWSMPEALVKSGVALVVNLPSLASDLPTLPEPKRKEIRDAYVARLDDFDAFLRLARSYVGSSAIAAAMVDRRLEAMGPFLRGDAPVFFNANSLKEIREALRFAQHYHLRPVIVGARQAWKAADEIARAQADVIIVRTQVLPSGEFDPWDSVYRNAAVLASAGVRYCFATGGSSLAKLLGLEAAMAVAHGLDEQHALRALTIDAARILGVDARLGSIAQGKTATFFISTATPLQPDSAVVAAFIAGRPIHLSSRHTRLDEKFRQRPPPDLPAAPVLRGAPGLRLTPEKGR